MTTVLVLEHDPSDPLLRLGLWLTDAGACCDVRRLHAGDQLPDDPTAFDAVLSLGGDMGAQDDDVAPWLPATRVLLAAAVRAGVPVLGICLGAQLLAVATGGGVHAGTDGPEVGAFLTAKRDAAETDPLFGPLPLTPDVMHDHRDVVDPLPPGAVLLLSSTGYQNQAFRIGQAAWGIQFHIETSATDLRRWAVAEGLQPTGRLGQRLDEADELMPLVWRPFLERFVAFAADRAQSGLKGRRLPLAGSA